MKHLASNDFHFFKILAVKTNNFFLRANHKENAYCWTDPNQFLQDLPPNIKREILLVSYAELLEKINLFHIDANFTSAILPHLTMFNLNEKEIIWRQEDPADEGK